jgi:hypothetical protein
MKNNNLLFTFSLLWNQNGYNVYFITCLLPCGKTKLFLSNLRSKIQFFWVFESFPWEICFTYIFGILRRWPIVFLYPIASFLCCPFMCLVVTLWLLDFCVEGCFKRVITLYTWGTILFFSFCRSICSLLYSIVWCTPKLLNRLKCESEVKITNEQGVEAHSLAHNTSGVEGRVGVPWWD